MTDPRRHHYVPQFHQRRFAGADGRLWVWDKTADRVFQTTPGSIAVEADFYRLREFEKLGRDPFTMEKQLSEMEGQMSLITEQWLGWLRAIEPGQRIEIPELNRDIVARFMAVQFLRTADTRDILDAIHATDHPEKLLSKEADVGSHHRRFDCKPYQEGDLGFRQEYDLHALRDLRQPGRFPDEGQRHVAQGRLRGKRNLCGLSACARCRHVLP